MGNSDHGMETQTNPTPGSRSCCRSPPTTTTRPRPTPTTTSPRCPTGPSLQVSILNPKPGGLDVMRVGVEG